MKDKERIAGMIRCTEKILGYCEGKDYDSFVSDSMLVEACVFNLSQLGEFCHGVSDETVTEHPEVPWREMYGLRNRIVHFYEGVNLKLVWEIISGDLVDLLAILQSIQ